MIQVDPGFWKTPIWTLLPDPPVVIKSLHRVIKRRYRTSKIVSQRRSVGLYLAKRSIDIVPAVATRKDNVFLIPDTRLEEWIETAPERHTWRIQELNGMNDQLFVPLVKLLEYWNARLPSTAYFKSFGIESIAAQLFASVPIDSLEDGLLKFFDFVAHISSKADDDGAFAWDKTFNVSLGFLGARAPDISGLGGNALGGVRRARRLAFAKKAKVARNHLIAIGDNPTDANIHKRLDKLF